MNIKFKHLEFSNFMSFGNGSVDLDSRGYTLISGVNESVEDSARSNGSGKSSIFEAIVWCLTGNTLRGNKSVSNYNGSDGALVILDFEVNGKIYKLIRSRDHSEYKTTLKIFVDGVDQSGKGIRDTEKLLTEFLPQLTPNLIGSVVILGQGLPSKFSNNSPSGRKEVLEKLCNTDFMIEDIKSRIASRKEQLQAQEKRQEAEIVSLTTQIKVNRSTLEKIKLELEELLKQGDNSNIVEQLTQKSIELNTLFTERETRIAEISEQITSTQRLYDLQADASAQAIESIDSHYSTQINHEAVKLGQYKASLKLLQDEKERLENSPEFCPTCNQRFPNFRPPNTALLSSRIRDEQTVIFSIEESLDNLKREKASKLKEVEDLYSPALAAYKLDISKLSALLVISRNELSSLSREKEKVNTELAVLQERLATYKESVKKHTEAINELKEIVDDATSKLIVEQAALESTNTRMAIINKLSSLASRDFRGYLLSSVISDINSCAKKYCQDVFGTDLIEFVLEGNNISIKYNNKEYEALSGGERQKIDLIIQFAIRDVLSRYSNFSSNILGLDEIFDNLDDIGCDRMVELITNRLSDISSIFIVTHHTSELNIPCDDEIVVVKSSSGVSYIR